MSASQPPTENLSAFNSSVFKDANTESLSLSKAQSLFLGRTGTPNSTASGTTFTGALNVNGTTTTQGLTVNSGTIDMVNGSIVVNGNTGVRIVGIASQNTGSQNNISIGHNSSSSGVYDVSVGNYANCQTGTSYCTAIGYSANVNSSLSYATAVGSNASCSATNSTALGYGASASIGTSTALGSNSTASANGATAIGYGAIATGTSQIVLGRATETVYCPGTAANTSLVATKNITVNGCSVGQHPTLNVTTGNTVLGVDCGRVISTNANNNTLIGNSAGYNISNGFHNTHCGFNTGYAITTGSSNTSLGYNSYNTGNFSNSTAVGESTVIGASNSTAVGASSQAQAFGSTAIGSGAVATLANQIMLGTATETVYLPGSAGLKSLDASANILVAGIGIGIGSNAIGAANIFIGKGTAGVGAGSNNTIIGRNNYGATSTAGTANTFLGASGGQNISGIINNATVIGANTYSSTTSYDGITVLGAGGGVAGVNATAIGYGSQANAAGSTAIGYNAVATLANSIVLGTSSNTVYCHGTSTTNGALQLAGGLVLQSTYGTIASNMIGYTISPAKTTANPLLATNGTVSNLYSFTVPLGVWLLIYQVYFTSTNTLTVTFVNSTMALTSTGSNGFQTTSGQMVRNATETFNNVAQSQSGSSCVIVNTTAPFTLYYNVGAIYSGIGSLTAAGSYSLTRIA